MKVTISSNIGLAQRKLVAFDKKLKTAPANIYARFGKIVIAQAHREVPYDTGRLMKGTEFVTRKHRGSVEVQFRSSAVNPKTGNNYALDQHENIKYKHLIGRKAHYLSDPIRVNTPWLTSTLERYIKL